MCEGVRGKSHWIEVAGAVVAIAAMVIILAIVIRPRPVHGAERECWRVEVDDDPVQGVILPSDGACARVMVLSIYRRCEPMRDEPARLHCYVDALRRLSCRRLTCVES